MKKEIFWFVHQGGILEQEERSSRGGRGRTRLRPKRGRRLILSLLVICPCLRFICAGSIDRTRFGRLVSTSNGFHTRFLLLGWHYSLPPKATKQFIDFEDQTEVGTTLGAIASEIPVIDTAKAIANAEAQIGCQVISGFHSDTKFVVTGGRLTNPASLNCQIHSISQSVASP